MIDSHTHTSYSKHAIGSVDELVREAVAKGIEVLTVTDHAPFHQDSQNRLLEYELDQYFTDIDNAKQKYRNEIKILCGLEFDYMPGAYNYTSRIIEKFDLDFAMGSIHYIPVSSDHQVKVWELSRLADTSVLGSYFNALSELLECGLFDAVGHADTILRGIPDSLLQEYFEPLLPLFINHGVAFELNASGIRKSSLDLKSGQEVYGVWSYPSMALLPKLLSQSTTFTIGSDAHQPVDVGEGIAEVVDALIPIGLKCVSYFESRQRVDIPAQKLASNAA